MTSFYFQIMHSPPSPPACVFLDLSAPLVRCWDPESQGRRAPLGCSARGSRRPAGPSRDIKGSRRWMSKLGFARPRFGPGPGSPQAVHPNCPPHCKFGAPCASRQQPRDMTLRASPFPRLAGSSTLAPHQWLRVP